MPLEARHLCRQLLLAPPAALCALMWLTWGSIKRGPRRTARLSVRNALRIVSQEGLLSDQASLAAPTGEGQKSKQVQW